MLAVHNEWRARVGSPPLEWSEKLAGRAQEWANHLVAHGLYVPRRDGLTGENLFEIVGGHATPREVVNAWAGERTAYRYRTNTCAARCGHYLQVIWHDTRRVGCGAARRGSREVWVCDYDPPGNIVGERPY